MSFGCFCWYSHAAWILNCCPPSLGERWPSSLVVHPVGLEGFVCGWWFQSEPWKFWPKGDSQAEQHLCWRVHGSGLPGCSLGLGCVEQSRCTVPCTLQLLYGLRCATMTDHVQHFIHIHRKDGTNTVNKMAEYLPLIRRTKKSHINIDTIFWFTKNLECILVEYFCDEKNLNYANKFFKIITSHWKSCRMTLNRVWNVG